MNKSESNENEIIVGNRQTDKQVNDKQNSVNKSTNSWSPLLTDFDEPRWYWIIYVEFKWKKKNENRVSFGVRETKFYFSIFLLNLKKIAKILRLIFQKTGADRTITIL